MKEKNKTMDPKVLKVLIPIRSRAIHLARLGTKTIPIDNVGIDSILRSNDPN